MKRIRIVLNILLLIIVTLSCQDKSVKEKDSFFSQIRTKKIQSDQAVEWKNFGPGMSGYCEEFWCHPTDPNVMFMGPDMHVSYGTWDNGKSWQTIKDSDGLGLDMKRVLDMEFSLQNPDFGMALDWNGWVYQTTDRGHSWNKTSELGKSYKDVGIDPNDLKSFEKGWYYEQEGTRHSELAVDPTNENIWYVGAGEFYNVKSNHRSKAKPHGITLKYASYGYIYKSTDKGETWEKITNGLSENTDVGSIVINPNHANHVIMATNLGVMHSFDAGLSWENKAKGLPNNLPRDLTSHYNSQTKEFVLYLAEQTVYEEHGDTVSSNGGIFKSMDGGLNWENITSNLFIDLNEIHFDAEIDRYYKTISYWFGISMNESKAKFTRLPKKALPVFNRIVVNPLNKNEIYITFNKKHDFTFGAGDVWRTLDGGVSWICCARNGSYWKSGMDKKYWEQRGNPLDTNMEFAHLQTYMDHSAAKSGNRFLEINAIGEVFIEVDQQTLKSTDKGTTWQQIDDFETSKGSGKWIGRGASNLPGRVILHETGIPERRLLCSGEHGLWQTTNLEGWEDNQAVAVEQIEGQVHDYDGQNGAHSISTVAVHQNDPNIIYILVWRQEHRGKLRRTTDGGKTWENISTIFESSNNSWENLAPQNSLIIDPVNPDNMYFCSTSVKISEISGSPAEKLTKGGYGFYRSFDGGYTWELSNNGIHKDASIRRIAIDPTNPETFYAASNDDNGGLYVSKNKGDNWERVVIPSEIKAVNHVFIDRNTNDILISTGRRTGTYKEGGVWRSKNNGKTWEHIFKAPYVWQAETSPVNPKLIVISVPNQIVSMARDFMNPGIYLSKDSGETWTKMNKGLGQPDKIVDVKPDPYNENVLWCAAWGSGWYVAYLNGYKQSWLPTND